MGADIHPSGSMCKYADIANGLFRCNVVLGYRGCGCGDCNFQKVMNLGDIRTGLDDSGNPILTIGDQSQIDPASVCMPQGWQGPLAPGQVYCSAPATTPQGGGYGTTTPMTGSIVPGIPNSNIYLAVAAVAALFLFASMRR